MPQLKKTWVPEQILNTQKMRRDTELAISREDGAAFSTALQETSKSESSRPKGKQNMQRKNNVATKSKSKDGQTLAVSCPGTRVNAFTSDGRAHATPPSRAKRFPSLGLRRGSLTSKIANLWEVCAHVRATSLGCLAQVLVLRMSLAGGRELR
jgi:hypothetical protein